MQKFSKILESKHQIKYIRYVIDYDRSEECNFKFLSLLSIAIDNKLKNNSHDNIEANYFNFNTDYGKTIFLVFIHDDYNDIHVNAYHDVYDAFSNSIQLYYDNIKYAEYGYCIKIFKHKVEELPEQFDTNRYYYDNKKHMFYANFDKVKNINEIEIVHEYKNNEKIKNLLKSSNAVSKFKL